MTAFRVIVTSDWHLDKLTLGVSRFADIVDAANEVVDYAVQSNRHESRSVFVFAGDLCNPDTPRCWAAVRAATRMRAKLIEGCVPSVWLTGNHDVMEDGNGSHTLMALDDGHPLVHVVDGPSGCRCGGGCGYCCSRTCQRRRWGCTVLNRGCCSTPRPTNKVWIWLLAT
jgi:DNA repair exonuclease SbcCD nuclease subunit